MIHAEPQTKILKLSRDKRFSFPSVTPSLLLNGLLFVAMCPAVAAGEDASAQAVASAPKPAADDALSNRMVSRHVAELLAASTPKFKPPPAKSKPSESINSGVAGEERAPESFGRPPIFSDRDPASSAIARATSKPQNPADAVTSTDAIKLPSVLVTATKLRLPDQEQVMSRDEFAALLRKRYPGSSIRGQDPYHIANGMPNYARLQFESDRRITQKASFKDFADLLERTGDHFGSERVKKEIQGALGGANTDPLIDAMDKSANGWRR